MNPLVLPKTLGSGVPLVGASARPPWACEAWPAGSGEASTREDPTGIGDRDIRPQEPMADDAQPASTAFLRRRREEP